MTETNGHFEKGIWIEGTVPATETPDPVDKRLSEATKSLRESIEELVTATFDLFTTDEGKMCMGRTFEEAQAQLRKSYDEIRARAKIELEEVKAGEPDHSSHNKKP